MQSDESCDSGVRKYLFMTDLSVSHCRDQSGLVGCVGFGSNDLNSPQNKIKKDCNIISQGSGGKPICAGIQ